MDGFWAALAPDEAQECDAMTGYLCTCATGQQSAIAYISVERTYDEETRSELRTDDRRAWPRIERHRCRRGGALRSADCRFVRLPCRRPGPAGSAAAGFPGLRPRAEHLQLAQKAAGSPRERLHQQALRAWLARAPRQRGLAFEQILAEWPLDLLAFRQHTGTLFWMGNKRHQAQIASCVASHWEEKIPGHALFLSAYAFAMEEVGHYPEAERAARQALEL
jgi:hypothetical protein